MDQNDMNADRHPTRKPTADDFRTAESLIAKMRAPPKCGTPAYDDLRIHYAGLRADFGDRKFDLYYGLRPPENALEELRRLRFRDEISQEEFDRRGRAYAQRPIDREMLTTYSDLQADAVEAYAAMRQAIEEAATVANTQADQHRKELEVDEHVAQMTAKCQMLRDELMTVDAFLSERRAASGQGVVRLGEHTQPNAHKLAFHILRVAAEAWGRCRARADGTSDSNDCAHRKSASAYFHEGCIPDLPNPNEMLALMEQEYAVADRHLREAELHRLQSTKTSLVRIQARSVKISTPRVHGPELKSRDRNRAHTRGKPGKEKWRVAQKSLFARLRAGTLPHSLRDAAKAIKHSYDTTRRAAHKSASLKSHFNLSEPGQQSDPGTPSLFEELLQEADARTRAMLEKLGPRERASTVAALSQIERAAWPDLLKTLAANPEAGSSGDVSIIENADQSQDDS